MEYAELFCVPKGAKSAKNSRMLTHPAVLLFQFPELDLLRFFVESEVAVVAALFDISCFQGGTDSAVRLFPVGAVVKPTLSDIVSKIREGILEVLFQNHFHLIRIKRRKTRGIGNVGVLPQSIQFHMSGGMSSTAQLL